MTNEIPTCPTAEQLRGLLEESLSQDEQATLQAHVDSCEACQKALEALVAGSESWDAAVGHLREDSHVADEPELAEAVRRIKADDFVEAAGHGMDSARPLDFLEPSDQPGSIGRLGTYEVSEIVGQGGMGVVVKAFDPALHRVVAVKVLAPYLANNPQARKRFVREAQAIAAVSHDHVITIHGIDESVEQPKIVMQFISGRSLQEKLDAEGSLDLKEILRIGMQTAAGLAAAHAQGLVHRDVKPSNILLENGIQRVKLTDFGLARAVDDASLTQSGVIAGTPQYMAPEQANGDAVDHRADLFSLGSVMYAMCVGHSPFRASTTMGVLKRVCHDPPRPIQELNPDIPDWLCAIIMKLLAKAPVDRFQSARQVADLLEKWLAHVQQPTVVPKPGAVGPTPFQRSEAQATASPELPLASLGLADVYSRTIFFQPISGRSFLLVFLASATAAMIYGIANRIESPELVLISFIGGLTVSFWIFLLTALGRFLWAQFSLLRHWIRGTKPPASNVPAGSLRRGLPPESLAMLSAIVVMLISSNILIAAIVAIIVWRVTSALLVTPAVRQEAGPDAPRSGSAAATAPRSGSWSNGIAGLLQRLGTNLGRLFELEPKERNRLLLVIGWCLSGAIDLFWIVELLDDLRSTLAPAFLFASTVALLLLSFATAFCIYVRQNFDQIRGASFLGLLPLSLGAILRIPLSIVTLFWLHRPETRESFSPLPWQESHLGRWLKERARFRDIAVNALWLAGWTAICAAAIALVIFGYVIPSGPSMYHIRDDSIEVITNKDHDLTFGMHGSGAGNGQGIRPSRLVYRCDRLTLVSPVPRQEMQVRLTTPVSIDIDGAGHLRQLTQVDLEDYFLKISGARHSKEASSLLQSIQQIDAAQGSVVPRNPFTLSLAEQRQDNDRVLFDASDRALPEFVAYAELATLLDPAVFDVRKQSHRAVRLALNPVDWMMVMIGVVSLVVWLAGMWWFVSWRKRARVRREEHSRPANNNDPASLETVPMTP